MPAVAASETCEPASKKSKDENAATDALLNLQEKTSGVDDKRPS